MSRDEKSRRSIAFWTPVSGAAKGSNELYPAAYAMERGDAIAAFFDRYRPGSDLRELVDGFRQLARDVGFSASAAGAWIGTGVNRTSRFFFNDWPTDWLKRYADGNFGKRDPIVLEAHRRIEPFQWTEMLDQPTFKADGAEVWAAGQDYGWVDGFSVPIHGPGGYQALVSLASLQPITLPAGDRRLLQAVALFVHDECRHGIDPGLPPLPALSPRQLECLRWVAAGKTDAEIGRVLGITTPTVHFHIEGAKRLLGLRSRSQAVAVLVLHGLV